MNTESQRGSNASRPSVSMSIGLWLGSMLLLAGVIIWRLDLSYDLGLFLPSPQTPSQQILVERLGESPGSRYVLIAVPDDDEATAFLVQTLQQLGSVSRVLSDGTTPEITEPIEPLWSGRFLLADMDWSARGLNLALSLRLGELGMGADPGFESVVARDPALLILDILHSLSPGHRSSWITDDGLRILIAETSAPAFDIAAQTRAVSAIRSAVTTAFPDDARAVLSGAGVFGTQLQETIRREATLRSTLASFAILLVLWVAYRKIRVLWMAALPLMTGLLTGTAAVALMFGTVHGITLAFGFTLMGVAIDYPLHLISHARSRPPETALKHTWPTLRLSALSTALAYGALTLGGAQGMAQLGLFSAAGVLGALAATRWLLPALLASPTHEDPGVTGPAVSEPRIGFLVPVVMMALAVLLALFVAKDPWWSSDLAALSPVPERQLILEGQLREATGAPNIRYQIAVTDHDLEAVLNGTESLHETLLVARERDLLDDFRDLTTLLPSPSTQALRQGKIPGKEELRSRLEEAAANLPFSAVAFTGFINDAELAKRSPPITPEDYRASELGGALEPFLYHSEEQGWVSLVSLHGTLEVDALASFLSTTHPQALLVDFRHASEELVTDYRHKTFLVLSVVLIAIAGLLLWRVHARRALWALSVVLAAVALDAALLRWVFGPLDLYHLTGLLLVAGIGLDYALFLGKPDDGASRHAVSACMASTVAAFTILAASAIPALSSLGFTVATGSALCFLAARLGSGRRQP